MGRPQKVSEEKRSEKITFRLTRVEKNDLKNAAGVCGVSTGNLIREKLLKGKFPKARMPKTDVAVYAELKKIGTNVNMLSKLVNAGKVPISMLTILEKLKAQQDKIIRILIDDSHSENR
jgi:hypothetical protein